MNRIVNDGLVNDEYIMPCNFNDMGDDNECEENSLRAHLDMNLHSVSRDDTFNFDGSFSQDDPQICSSGVPEDIEDNLFSNSRDLLGDVYRNYDSSEDCTRLTTCHDNSNRCLPNDGTNEHTLHCDSTNDRVTHNDNANSITKTLRGIKRVPPPQQSTTSLQSSENLTFISNSTYKPSYDVLSCTVLIDTSSKNHVDFELASDDKCLNGVQTVRNKSQQQKTLNGFNDDKKYQCTDCDKRFRVRSHLVSHSRAHRDERKFKCDKCDLTFKTEINLRFHIDSHSQTPLKCPDCNKIFTARRVLSRHIRVVHSRENFECEQCGKKFKTRRNLIHHYGIHSGIRPFACSICSKTFLHSSSLNIHMREHALEDCSQCSPAIQISTLEMQCTNSPLTNPLLNTFTDKTDQCSCGSLCTGECAKIVKTSSCNHLLKPFLCSTCGKPFKLRSSLVSHMKSHAPSKQYKCEDCDKIFSKKMSYELHMKRHRGERPEYMCDQCCQSYYSQFSLRRHYLKHTTRPSFICSVCSKTFWMKDALLVHLRSHTKVKNFKCTMCDKSFSHKSSLVIHTRSLHPESSQLHQPVRSSSEMVLNPSRKNQEEDNLKKKKKH